MSADFWLGMFAIPAAALALALIYGAGSMAIYFTERIDVGSWKIWPKRVQKYNRGSIASTVAGAKWVRYFWVPGWHVVFCRTRLVRQGDSLSQHRELSGIIDRFVEDHAPADEANR